MGNRSATGLRSATRFQPTIHRGPICIGPRCILALALLSGCPSTAADPPQFGEPVGLLVENSVSGERSFELAVSITKDVDPRPLLDGVVTLMRPALRACPAYLDAPRNDPSSPLTLLIEKGHLVPAKTATPNEATLCMVRSLSAQPLPPSLLREARLDLMIQARVPPPP